MVQTHIRLSPDEAKRVEKLALQEDRSFAGAVRLLVREALERRADGEPRRAST